MPRASRTKRERDKDAARRDGEIVLSGRAYQRLVGDLRGVLEEGKQRAEEAVGRELVRTYHEVGQRIITARLTKRAGYGSATLDRLAEDLEMHPRALHQAVAFARAYAELPAELGRLRWVHYRELTRISDPERRGRLEREAAARGWSHARLVEAIRQGKDAGEGRGRKKEGRAAAVKLKRPSEATYVYKASVDRVVDGDTLVLLIDLGFEVLKRQRVRLAAIDAPGPKERGGVEAQDFVRDTLARVDFVMVKTTKIDLHGRFVGHLFYAPGEEDKLAVFTHGRYLNQDLVSKGLAIPL